MQLGSLWLKLPEIHLDVSTEKASLEESPLLLSTPGVIFGGRKKKEIKNKIQLFFFLLCAITPKYRFSLVYTKISL